MVLQKFRGTIQALDKGENQQAAQSDAAPTGHTAASSLGKHTPNKDLDDDIPF